MRITNYAGALAALPDWPTDSIQALGFELGSWRRLACDGVAGPKTRTGVFLIPTEGDPRLVVEMLDFVRRGIQESTAGNNKGAGPAEMHGACSEETCDPEDWEEVKQGAWCAATVSRALINMVLLGFVIIRGARRLADWLVDAFGVGRPEAGNVIAWKVPRPKVPHGGHVGVICHVESGRVFVIEGNGSARLGRVRVYVYDLPSILYGEGKHPVSAIAKTKDL